MSIDASRKAKELTSGWQLAGRRLGQGFAVRAWRGGGGGVRRRRDCGRRWQEEGREEGEGQGECSSSSSFSTHTPTRTHTHIRPHPHRHTPTHTPHTHTLRTPTHLHSYTPALSHTCTLTHLHTSTTDKDSPAQTTPAKKKAAPKTKPKAAAKRGRGKTTAKPKTPKAKAAKSKTPAKASATPASAGRQPVSSSVANHNVKQVSLSCSSHHRLTPQVLASKLPATHESAVAVLAKGAELELALYKADVERTLAKEVNNVFIPPFERSPAFKRFWALYQGMGETAAEDVEEEDDGAGEDARADDGAAVPSLPLLTHDSGIPVTAVGTGDACASRGRSVPNSALEGITEVRIGCPLYWLPVLDNVPSRRQDQVGPSRRSSLRAEVALHGLLPVAGQRRCDRQGRSRVRLARVGQRRTTSLWLVAVARSSLLRKVHRRLTSSSHTSGSR